MSEVFYSCGELNVDFLLYTLLIFSLSIMITGATDTSVTRGYSTT